MASKSLELGECCRAGSTFTYSFSLLFSTPNFCFMHDRPVIAIRIVKTSNLHE